MMRCKILLGDSYLDVVLLKVSYHMIYHLVILSLYDDDSDAQYIFFVQVHL